MSKTAENIIVIAIAVAIVACLLCFVGYDGIKDWLSEPIVWKDHPDVDIDFVGKIEVGNVIELHFNIYNRTDQKINKYQFLAYVEGTQLNIPAKYSLRSINAHSTGYEIVYITKDENASASAVKVDADTYYRVLIMGKEQLDVSIKTVYLKGENGTLLENNGTWKIVIILVLSLVLGILGLMERFPVWLRITFKVCGMLAVIVLLVLAVLYVAWRNNYLRRQEEERARRR